MYTISIAHLVPCWVLNQNEITSSNIRVDCNLQLKGCLVPSIGEPAIANNFGTVTAIPRRHTGNPCESFEGWRLLNCWPHKPTRLQWAKVNKLIFAPGSRLQIYGIDEIQSVVTGISRRCWRQNDNGIIPVHLRKKNKYYNELTEKISPITLTSIKSINWLFHTTDGLLSGLVLMLDTM